MTIFSKRYKADSSQPAIVPKPASTFTAPAPAAPAAPPAPPREPSPPPAPPAAPPAIPAASRPTPPQRIASAFTPAPTEPAKPVADDRIAPVGTAYEPVKLATPGKLANRWNPAAQDTAAEDTPTGGSIKDRMSAFSGGGGGAPSPAASQPSGKKLTWSERQAETKRQQEEEESRSSAAIAGRATGRVASSAGNAVSSAATAAGMSIMAVDSHRLTTRSWCRRCGIGGHGAHSRS